MKLRSILVLASASVLALGISGCGSDDPDDASDSSSYDTSVRDSVASWLSTQVDGGLAHNRQYGMDDYSLSAEIAIGLAAADVEDATVDEIATALQDNEEAYVSPGFGTLFSTGSAAKLAVALDEGDIETDELETEITDHATDGVIADELDPKNKKAVDYANVIGQAFAVEATDSQDLVDGLIGQQCEDGGFPQMFATGGECSSDTDGTAFALLALNSIDDHTDETHQSLTDASAWLADQQADDGSFSSTQPPVANTNTTGLAGWALAESGDTEAAEAAAGWVAEHVLGCDSPAPGAIAFDDTALQQGESKGLTKKTEGQFQLATAQALPVLSYLPADAVPEGVGAC